MATSASDRWERGLKIAGVIVTLTGVALGGIQFLANARREYQRAFFDKQLALYMEAAQTTSVLASSTDQAVRKKAEARFWELYWGQLALVEDRAVAGKMVEFGQALKDFDQQDLTELQRASYDLAHALRDSLREAWPIPSGFVPKTPSDGGGLSTPGG